MAKKMTLDRALPPVRLYLDDLEDIERIINEATGSEQPVSFSYEVNGEDIYSSIAEMKDVGSYATEFSMQANGSELFTITNWLSPRLGIPYGLKLDEWSYAAKLRSVFERRRDRLQALGATIRDQPAIATVLGTLFGYGAVVLLLDGMRRVGYRTTPIPRTVVLTALVVTSLLGFCIYAVFRNNRVNLSYKREDAKQSRDRRHELIQRALLALFSSVVSFALGWFFGKRH